MSTGSTGMGNGTAMDLLLKTLMQSKNFTPVPKKDWEFLSKIVPGTTSKQIQRRYEELLAQMSSGDYLSVSQNFLKSQTKQLPSIKSENDLDRAAKAKGDRPEGSKTEKDMHASKSHHSRTANGDLGPTMVIHVCDEAKNLKKDFNCPRDLLVEEMKYFAEYLSMDAQRWEEVDISVHCDVQIFDWLMKYVKRTTKEVKVQPKLEASNVVSILISSDFLKMDSLVQECIEFCHMNMSAVVATPCNMNCINEVLVGRITALFNHNEADEIKDRKDKFKSKIFARFTEKLFDSEAVNPCSPENASTLYRCNICRKILTKTTEKKFKCNSSRMIVNKKGGFSFCHVRDSSWDVNEYLLDMRANKKSWRDIYWHIWGLVNYLYCSRCQEAVPCVELGHCKFHTEKATYQVVNGVSGVGTFPCCLMKSLRFDPTGKREGCRVRDHLVNVPESSDGATTSNVYEDLLAHRDVICVPYEGGAIMTNDKQLNVFANDEFLCGLREEGVGMSKKESNMLSDCSSAPRLHPLTMEASTMYDDVSEDNSDDEVGDDEPPRGPKFRAGKAKQRVTVEEQAILVDAPDFSTATSKKNRWDTNRSLRFNQDSQREEDMKRMNEMIRYLTKLHFGQDKMEKLKQKEYAGGLYSRIESQWKAANTPQPKPLATGQFRAKTRLSTAR